MFCWKDRSFSSKWVSRLSNGRFQKKILKESMCWHWLALRHEIALSTTAISFSSGLDIGFALSELLNLIGHQQPGPRIPTGACQPIFNVAGSSERKRVLCDKFYMVNWFDGLPFRIKTTNMVGAVSTIGYHFSEKEIIKEKSGYFLSWSLQGCSEPASQACGLAWILRPGP